MKPFATALLLAGIALAGCGEGRTDPPAPENTMSTMVLSQVTDAQWKALASRRIFFGHQSVGRNIIAGMRKVLEEHPEISLRIVNADDPASVDGAAFIEANIGQNGGPATKADDFAKAVDGGLGRESGAVAMYKYCYVDVTPETDPESLFADYVRRIETIHAKYPRLTIVHFTMPLVTAPDNWKQRLKTRLRMDTELALNIKRNRYNELLRERFGANEPVFDLAQLESTRADGSRAYANYRGRRIFMLAPEWTEDAGHLNETAQRRVAEQLLVFLATLQSSTEPSAVTADREQTTL